jgi:hypothetical protein
MMHQWMRTAQLRFLVIFPFQNIAARLFLAALGHTWVEKRIITELNQAIAYGSVLNVPLLPGP